MSLTARIAYALCAFPVAAFLSFYITLYGMERTTSHSPHSSMWGLVIFMAALAIAFACAITASLVALTLPWKRSVMTAGMHGRMAVSGAFVLAAFISLIVLNYQPIFASILSIWLAAVGYFTYVRHGITDR